MSNNIKKIILYILVILWMIVIFIFSNTNGSQSSETSGFIVNGIVYIFENVFKQPISLVSLNNLTYIIRKLAHIIEYLILGILVYMLLSTYNISTKKRMIISILICILYACTDEIHQLFIYERTGSIRDVLYDTFGSYIGVKLTQNKSIIRR